jgi:hypothetical protein
MANNYVDIKVQMWRRFHFDEDADMQKVANMLQETQNVGDVIDDDLGFLETEDLYETEEEMSIEDNGGCATVEVISQGKTIYDNE